MMKIVAKNQFTTVETKDTYVHVQFRPEYYLTLLHDSSALLHWNAPETCTIGIYT